MSAIDLNNLPPHLTAMQDRIKNLLAMVPPEAHEEIFNSVRQSATAMGISPEKVDAILASIQETENQDPEVNQMHVQVHSVVVDGVTVEMVSLKDFQTLLTHAKEMEQQADEDVEMLTNAESMVNGLSTTLSLVLQSAAKSTDPNLRTIGVQTQSMLKQSFPELF